MKYELVRPCPHCPFRSDVPGFLREDRASEIASCSGDFACHETVDYDDDGEGISGAQHCAGALILAEKIEQPHQMMRIAERLGFYDMRRLDMTAPVFDDADAMIEHHARG